MSRALEALEEAVLSDRDDSLHCMAKITSHPCTEIARWICYASPQCTPEGGSSYLWCDSRYAHYLKDLDVKCYCGRIVGEHWKVIPL